MRVPLPDMPERAGVDKLQDGKRVLMRRFLCIAGLGLAFGIIFASPALANRGPAYLLEGPKTYRVHDHDYKRVFCTVTISDGGDHGVIDASRCAMLGPLARARTITGDEARQSYRDAKGTEVVWGTHKEDGFWINLPDGRDVYLD